MELPKELLDSERDITEKSMETSNTEEQEERVFPADALVILTGNYSVFELKRKYEKGLIILDPDFQRDDVWNSKQKIELVESILMGLPLPVFYFNRNTDGELVVVDGRQRLSALFAYMDDKFALKDLAVLPAEFEKKFSDLNQLYKSKIEDYQIHAYEIQPETKQSVLFHIFDRINRGGTKLNKQEIRNALYQGTSSRLLKDVAHSELFSKASGNGLGKDKLQKREYLVLRFLAFYFLRNRMLQAENGNEFVYKDIDSLLSTTMEQINRMSKPEVYSVSSLIETALNNCIQYTYEDVFRLNWNGKKSPINMNVFEVVMYIMASLPSGLQPEDVSGKINQLKLSEKFIENIGNHRDSENKVKERFDMADAIIRELK